MTPHRAALIALRRNHAAQRAVALLAALGLTAGLGGCGDEAAPPGAGLRAGVEQYREDEVAGRLQVRLLSDSTDPVAVTGVELRWPGLTTDPASVETALRPGVAADLPVTLGAADCGVLPAAISTQPGPPPDAAATAVVTVGGEPVSVPIADPDGVLQRIWARDCRRQQIAERVAVRFAAEWTRVEGDASRPPAARGELIVEPNGGIASVTELRETVIAALRTSDPLPAATPIRLPVTVGTNGRCTGHVLGEVKKPFDFAIGLLIDGVAVTATPVRPDDASQRLLRQVVEDGCAIIAPTG